MKDLKEEYDYLVDYAIKRGKELGISAIQFLTSEEYDWKTYNEFAYHKQKYKDFITKYNGLYVYFLMKDNKIEYIGSSINLYRRLHHHTSNQLYDFDSVTFFDYSKCNITEAELRQIECYFIEKNRTYIKNKNVFTYDKRNIKQLLQKVEHVSPRTISKEDINLL